MLMIDLGIPKDPQRSLCVLENRPFFQYLVFFVLFLFFQSKQHYSFFLPGAKDGMKTHKKSIRKKHKGLASVET